MEFKTTENIRFLISKTSVKKPLIIFIRGSDFAPPFVNNMYNVFPFDIEEYKDKFNLVLLLKPGIPIFSDSLSNKFINETYKNGYYLDNNAQVPNEFIKNNNLYYYRNAIDIIIKHLKKEKYVDKEKIFLIGHSQGANVAISTALKNKKIKKIALLSTHIGDRFSEQIKKIRFKENNLNISHESAQLEIDSLYKTYVQLSKDKFNNQKLLDNNTYFSYGSFTFPNIESKIIQIKIPTLVSFGTNSIQDLDCDELKFILFRKNIHNVEVKTYVGYDHNFNVLKKRDENEPLELFYEWNTVFNETINWLMK